MARSDCRSISDWPRSIQILTQDAGVGGRLILSMKWVDTRSSLGRVDSPLPCCHEVGAWVGP